MAAALVAASFASGASAALVDLSAFGLTAKDGPYLSFDGVAVVADAGSAVANNSFLDAVLLAATGIAPYGNSDFVLTLSDALGSGLDAESLARGYSDSGDLGDALFSVTSASGAFAGLSASLYVEIDIPAGIFDGFATTGATSFSTSFRIYETEAVGPGVVPLPATGILFSTVLAGLGLVARRRR
ncbi:hypothetical protein [Tropicimonas sp.]|uniref:hypothetical protein n=1 Tax=Tropicimonas sp. TaxID=2067044 RepID=UPI003A88558D